MDRANHTRFTILVCVLLGGATLAVFWPVFHHDFIIYDDHQYITENAHVLSGLTWENAKWALTSGYASNWHPLTWLSHMADIQLFGLKPGWHHFVNLGFHIANVVLLFLVLKRLTNALWRSAFVAGLFALHPLHVESVAWVAERKDVLSTLFFLLTVWTYSRYAQRQSNVESRGSRVRSESRTLDSRLSTLDYSLALLFFVLGLMSKPMVVTLPFVLLLLDYWPLGRFRPLVTPTDESPSPRQSAFLGPHLRAWSRLAAEKTPFFALSALSCVVTFLTQQGGGSMATLDAWPLGVRFANAAVAYLEYLVKLFWPSKLAVLYLAPTHWPVGLVALSLIVLASVTVLVFVPGGRRGYLATGWLWFLGTLVPVIGLVQVGNQFMADRYTYIPLVGCFIIVVWGAWDLLSRFPVMARVLPVAGCLLVVSAGTAARHQVAFWRNSETLLKHCLAVTTGNFIAHNNLAAALDAEGRSDEAKEHFLAALAIRPRDAGMLHNLGILLARKGDYAGAAPYLHEAVVLDPKLASVYLKLASLTDKAGDTAQAIVYYRESARLKPDQADVCNNLAWLLATSPDQKLRNGAEAAGWAELACGLTGYTQTVYVGTLAAAYAEAGRFQDATATAEKAIALAEAARQKDLAQTNRGLLELYRRQQAYHERAPSAPSAK